MRSFLGGGGCWEWGCVIGMGCDTGLNSKQHILVTLPPSLVAVRSSRILLHRSHIRKQPGLDVTPYAIEHGKQSLHPHS